MRFWLARNSIWYVFFGEDSTRTCGNINTTGPEIEGWENSSHFSFFFGLSLVCVVRESPTRIRISSFLLFFILQHTRSHSSLSSSFHFNSSDSTWFEPQKRVWSWVGENWARLLAARTPFSPPPLMHSWKISHHFSLLFTFSRFSLIFRSSKSHLSLETSTDRISDKDNTPLFNHTFLV